MKYRKMSSVLAFALLLSTAVSCGSEAVGDTQTVPDGTADTSAAVSETEPTVKALPDMDFRGEAFRIAVVNGAMPNFPEEEQNGETVNDTMIQRDTYIEETYHTDIQYTLYGGAAASAAIQKSVLAGDNDYDMAVDTAISLGNISKSDVLYDILSLPYLDTTQDWWSSLTAEQCQVGGKLYYLCGDMIPVVYTIPACIFMNNHLAEQYRIDTSDLQTKIQNGQWTYDVLLNLCKDSEKDLNGDGVIDTDSDQIAYLTEKGSLPAGLLLVSAGINLSDVDKNGRISVNLISDKILAFIDKISPIAESYCKINGDYYHNVFTDGRALFNQHYTSSAYTRYRDMKDDFSILPMPKYDEAQVGYRHLMNPWGAAFIGFPMNGNAEKMGLIAEAMGRYSYEHLRYAVYEEAFKLKGARDEDSAAMLDLIFNSLYLDHNAVFDFGGSMTAMSSAMFEGSELASVLAGISDKVQGDIDALTK